MMEVVADGAFRGPVDFAQRRSQRSHVSGEEAPEGSGGRAARVFGEHCRGIELRVHCHRKQQQTVPCPIAKVALQHGKVRRKPRAHVGQRAARIDEIDGHHFAAQIGGVKRAPLLVGELELRQRRTDGEFFRGSRERNVRRAIPPFMSCTEIPMARRVEGMLLGKSASRKSILRGVRSRG
jgi:hypothetical protein